jgi:hypothetical protein
MLLPYSSKELYSHSAPLIFNELDLQPNLTNKITQLIKTTLQYTYTAISFVSISDKFELSWV